MNFSSMICSCLYPPSPGNENTVTGGGNNVQKQNKRREKALLPLSGPEVLKDDSNLAILRFLLHPPGNISLT